VEEESSVSLGWELVLIERVDRVELGDVEKFGKGRREVYEKGGRRG